MFSFLKKYTAPKKQEEPVYYIGKSPVDPEFIYLGDDEDYIAHLTAYIRMLHEEILKNEAYDNEQKNAPIYYFLEWDKNNHELQLGRLGQTIDKSDRNYTCILLREVLDETIKKYPLFAPSLYNDFFNESDDVVKKDLKTLGLDAFEKRVLRQKKSSVYEDNKHVLNAAMDNLYALSVDSYLKDLQTTYPLLDKKTLVGAWGSWRDKVIKAKNNASMLPLMIELPFRQKDHHHISFICQLIEPLFDELDNYRIFWWRDEATSKAWCFISDTKREALLDLFLFDEEQRQGATRLDYADAPTFNGNAPFSLFEALQINQ